MLGYIKRSYTLILLSSFSLTQLTCKSQPFQPAQPIPQIKEYQENDYQIIHFPNGNRYRAKTSLYNWTMDNKHHIEEKYLKKLKDPIKMEKALDIIDANKDRTISNLEVNLSILFLQRKLKDILDYEEPKHPITNIIEDINPTSDKIKKITNYFGTNTKPIYPTTVLK